MPTNMFDEARRRVSSGTSASYSQNDNIFSQARSRVNTGQTVDTVPAITQRSAASPLSTKKTNLDRIDLGQNEGKIGEGWERRVNTESLVGPSYKDTTAYYDRMLKQKKQTTKWISWVCWVCWSIWSFRLLLLSRTNLMHTFYIACCYLQDISFAGELLSWLPDLSRIASK